MKNANSQNTGATAATTSVFTKIVAVITALSLVFLQTPISGLSGQALADSTDAAQELLAANTAVDVPLTFENAYIKYEEQTIAEPATKVTLPAGAPFEFVAIADSGYQIESVKAVIDGTEVELSPDADGLYKLSATDVVMTSNITVRAITAPTAKEVVTVDEPEPEATETTNAEGPVTESDQAQSADSSSSAASPSASADASASAASPSAAPAQPEATTAKFTYEDDDVSVEAVLSQSDAVPANAVFQVKPITATSTGYNYDVLMDALNQSAADSEYTSENTLLYDVAFMVPVTDEAGNAVEGAFVEYEPAAGTVSITITFKKEQLAQGLEASQASDLEIIHLPLNSAVRDAAGSTQNATDIVVDDVSVESVPATVASVSDEQVGFTLRSLSPIAVSTANSRNLTAAAIDAGSGNNEPTNATPTSTNLAYFLTGATFNAPQNAEGKYVVTPGASYMFTLAFAENPRLQFPDDGSVMSYRLPDGLEVADGHRGTLNIKVNEGGSFYTVAGNEYWIEGGVLYFRFNTNDPYYSKLTAASNAKVNIAFSGSIDENAYDLHFKDGITKDLEVDTTNSVSTSKSAWVGTDGKVHYTVSIVSKGKSRNVVVKDTITSSNNVLTLDRDSIRATSNKVGNVSMNGNANGNSFQYTIGQMTDGEVVEFNYTATIDGARIQKDGNGRYIATGDNSVSVKSDGDPTPDIVNKHVTIDYTPGISKGNGVIVSDNGSSKTMLWTITANNNPKVSMAGSTITDMIGDQSRGIMAYSGTGVTVEVYDANGTKVDTRNVPWTSLNKTDSSWAYTVPQSDSGHAYKYVITYTTTVTPQNTANNTDVSNGAKIDNGNPTWSWGHIPGTGGNNGNNGNNGGSTTTPKVYLDKNVERVDLENREITWNITFNVPAEGLTSAVVTDTYPNSWINDHNAYEPVKEGSITVAGLKTGETYTVNYNNTNATITFYQNQNKTTAGLQAGEARVVTVTLKTVIDEEWLESSKTTTWQRSHKNNAKVTTNFNSPEDMAETIITDTSMSKNVSVAGSRTVDGVSLPIYKYELLLNNVTSDVNVIEDQFDTSVLQVMEWNPAWDTPYDQLRIFGGDFYAQGNQGPSQFSYVVTADGIRITTSPDTMPHNENVGSGMYTTYRLVYYLTVKDKAAYDELMTRAAQSDGGVYKLVNTAAWGDKTDSAEVTYEYAGLTKEILTPDSQLTQTDEDIWADFRITLNPSGAMLNGGMPMTMTDTYQGLSIDFNSITATPPEGVSWDASGNVVTYQIPDQTRVVITYRARVVFEDNGAVGETKHVAFSNVAEMNGYTGDINKTAHRTNNGSGQATINMVKVLKYEAGNMTNRLAGAEFALLDANKNPVKDQWGNDVTFTTDDTGYLEVGGHQMEYGWSIHENERYYLHETKAPTGYQLAGFDYSFQVSEDGTTDYSNYIYHNGDTLTVKNYAGTDVKVVKSWTDGNDAHGSDTVTVRLQQKIGDGNWSDTVRWQNAANGYAWEDAPDMTLVLGADNGWEGAFRGLPLEVPVSLGDPEADDVAADYRVIETLVNDAAPAAEAVSIQKDMDGGSYSFTITNTADAKTSVSGKKRWDDANNQDGLRPGQVTVNLLADGEIVDSVVLTAADADANGDWSYEFTDLPAKKNGADIVYTVTENAVGGYTPTINGFNITNTHTPEKTTYEVSKVWADGDNQDGFRTQTIAVQLYADNVAYGSAVVLSASNNWYAKWENLPAKKNGATIAYSAKEVSVPAHYTVSYDTTTAGKTVITNTHVPEVTSVNVQKNWSGNGAANGMQPSSVTAQLKKGGEVIDTYELTAAEGWKHTFSNLPKYENGTEISYSVDEIVPVDYQKSAQMANGTMVITNTYNPEKTGLKVVKNWNDDNNKEGFRPNKVTVQLLANGDPAVIDGVQTSVDLTEANEWQYEWTQLPKRLNGEEVEYSIREIAVTDYATTGPVTTADGLVITNDRTPEKTSVSGTKTWVDNDDQDGARPDYITVRLYANGAEVQSKDVYPDSQGSWAWTFDNLDKYANGAEIVYTISEDAVDGYTTSPITGSAKTGFVITNTHEPVTINIEGTKTWDDADNQDGIRPNSITVNLLANGAKVASTQVTPDANGDWKYEFKNQPKFAGGAEIVYTVSEEAVAGYTPTVSGVNVTNTHTPEKTEVSGSKTWADENDQDGKRPASITINLLANGEQVDSKTVTAADNWAWSFTGLDKYADGAEIVYTITEDDVDGYTKQVNGYNVTNTHTPEKTEVSGSKTWVDNDDQDGIRPESVTVRLLADGQEVATRNVTEADGWQWSFTGLDKYRDGGTEIVYTITEDDVPGYAKQVNGFNAINTHTPEKVNVSGAKTWVDGDNRDNVRPTSITINLLADGTQVDSKTVTAADGWAWSFAGLDKYRDGGTEIVYTITEDDVPGYAKQVSGYNAINTHEFEKTEVSGSKTWADADDQDGLRPTSVTVRLLADGQEVATKNVEADDEGNWTYTFNNLPKYRTGSVGEPIVYTVDEAAVEGYTTSIDGYNITNTHTPEKTSVSGSKTWADNDDQDGKRPTSITIKLFANGGDEPVQTKTVTAADNWAWSFTDLDKYADGAEIVYTIEEDEVENYSTEVDGYDVTNSYTPGKTSVSGSKTWADENDQDGLRPTSITINLLADGEQVDSRTVTAADGWAWSFTDLDEYAGGQKIAYTIAEEEVDGYTATVNGYNVTNTHAPSKIDLSGSKTWADENDQDGKRPTSITIKLFANGGDEPVRTKTVTEADGWAWSFEDLDEYAGGQKITYTVEEAAVDGYTATVDGYNVTNTHTPETTEVTVNKTWADNNDQDGKRPENITVSLFADGDFVKSQAIEGEGNTWSYTFDNLPKYRDGGTPIVYTVTEEAVEGYTTSEITGSAAEGFNITNTHTPATTKRVVKKIWNDADNQDGMRAQNVSVSLKADGTVVGTAVLSGSSKDWEYTFDNLPVYRDGGVAINYELVEDVSTPNYTKEVTNLGLGIALTNTHTPETVDVSGSKTWDDADDQDGLRPTSITVHLLADGEEIGSKTVSEADDWAYEWKGLPKYAGGIAINYAVTEDAVEGYTKTQNGYSFTNTHTPDETGVKVTKVWDDAYEGVENYDHLRPASVQVRLYADGAATDKVATLTAPSWTQEFTGLPTYKDGGVAIAYTVQEEDEISGYTIGRPTGDADEGYTITNTHAVEFTSLSGTKTWADSNNQDGKRPASITINLLANDEIVDTQEVTGEGNTWSYSFGNLDKYDANGQPITYSVTEGAVEGYTGSVDATGLNFTNTYAPEYTSVKVAKTWDDADDQDGLRPTSIAVSLQASVPSGEAVSLPTTATEAVTLPKDDGSWSHEWANLPVYQNGELITYTAVESLVADYEAKLVRNTAYDLTLKNTHQPATVDLSVDKAWVDAKAGSADDFDGLRPDSVAVQLYADDELYEEVALSDANSWHYEWKGLPEKADGQVINYEIRENDVPVGYEAQISRDGNAFTVVNTHEVVPVEVSGTKTWDDADDQDGKRPANITVNLLANGAQVESAVVEADADGNWAYAFSDLPRYANKQEIAYTVEEVVQTASPDDYSATQNGNDFVNSHTPETVDVSGIKTWDDADDQDGKRPANITVNLLADGEIADSTVVSPNASGEWAYSFTGLPKYRDHGVEIDYTVTETVDEQTAAAYTGSVNGFDITNTHAPEKTSVSGTKTWDDADNQDGKRPTSITVNLLANGVKVDSKMVTAADGWSWNFTDLDKYKDGSEITYTIAEEAVDGYQSAVEGYNATNSYTPGKVSLNGTKTWVDADNQDGIRPTSVVVNLFADGALIDSQTMSEATNWAYSFADLNEYANGSKIAYTVEEVAVPGYETTTDETGLNFTNKHTPETIEVSGTKTWNDNNDQDGKRPESITVRLLANGVEVASDEVSAADDWAYSFTELPKYQAGKAIKYSIVEDEVDGYTTTVDGVNLTNTYTPETVDVSGTKTWDDADDQDGKRPESITVNLLADGTQVDSKTVTAGGGWTWSFTGLPKYRDHGVEIAYTVTETVDEQTAAAYTGSVTGFDITNTHVPEKTSVSGTKTWDDADNQDGKRPASITVNLLADGRVVDTQVVTGTGNEWSYTFDNLAKYANGRAIVYTVSEEIVADYTPAIEGYDITNSYTPGQTSVSGAKVWDDADNQDGKRPTSITVNLLADGVQVDSQTVTDADNWTYSFTGLPEYKDGTKISYTVTEDEVADYTTEIDGTTITNSYTPEKTSVGVSKTWNDDNDRDGVRPASILLTLYANGSAVGTQEVTEADNWSYTFTDLDKYRKGVEITYTVGETIVPDGYTESAATQGVGMVNTHEVETVDVAGAKTWIDGNDRDGDRPASITVNLLADGNKVASRTVTAEDGWAYSFTGLPKYRDHGTAIVYTVAEEPVDHYEAAVTGYDITNTHIGEASVEFKALKHLESKARSLKADEFTFQIVENGEVIRTASNAADGRAFFAPITYTAADAGVHTYTISEVAGSLEGVKYDTTEYTVKVDVVDNRDGTIDAEYIDYDPAAGVTFTNEFTPYGTVDLVANKTLVGKDLLQGAYTFQVADKQGNVYATATNDADGTIAFPSLEFTAAGTYVYEITEVEPNGTQPFSNGRIADGVMLDESAAEVTIVATENTDGTLTFDTAYPAGGASFTNETVPDTHYPLTATKHIDGRSFAPGDAFTFTVTADDGAPLPANPSVTVEPTSGNDATIDFGEITFTPADLGNTYTYTIAEERSGETVDGLKYDTSTHWVNLTVGDAGDGTMSVRAVYQNDADGIVFTNTYTSETEAVLTATKVLDGRALEDGEFYFELSGGNLSEPLHAAASADGTVRFAPIAFTQDDAGKSYTYTISEVQGTLGGVTYDTSTYDVTLNVTDNGRGELSVAYDWGEAGAPPVFTNTYHADATSAALEAHKMLVGGKLTAGEFTFTLEGVSDNALGTSQTATNDADGLVAFDEIAYTEPGTYAYRIAEVVPEGATTDEDGVVTGPDDIVYDTAPHTATVTVSDNGYGKLVADVSYDEGAAGISFGNIALKRTGFTFDKYFFGGVGTFDFTMTAVDASGTPRAGSPVDYSDRLTIADDGETAFTATVQNGAYEDGKAEVVFPGITYAADGDYYYLVEEAESSAASMIADEAQYLVHVVVANGAAATTYELIYQGVNYGETADLAFYNNSNVTLGFASMSAASAGDYGQRVSVYPEAKKYLNGTTDQLVGGEFTFELVDQATGKVIAAATNDEHGKVAFFDEDTDPGLAYDAPGTYYYTMREVAGDEAGITYDDSAILVVVDVEQTGNGLAATVTYNGPGGPEPAFYNLKEGIDVEVYKVSRFGGEGLDNCTYALWMAGEAGDVLMQEATSDETGRIIFHDVTLIPGQKYFFKEVEAPKGHTVDPYRTAYFSLNETGDALVLVEDTASDGWHSANENIEIDKAKGEAI